MVPNAMAKRVPIGNHPATTWPDDCPSGRSRTTLPCASSPTGLLGTTRDVSPSASAISSMTSFNTENRSARTTASAPSRAHPVVERDDRRSADCRGQPSRRLLVGARELEGLATGSELTRDGGSDASGADDRRGHDGDLRSDRNLTPTCSTTIDRGTNLPPGPSFVPLRSDDHRDRGYSNGFRTGAASVASGIPHRARSIRCTQRACP